MSIKLRELIRQVRACKTAAEERGVIAKECALIRTSFKEKVDTGFRHRNVAKLLYIHMLGYPTHFGQVECLKLIASNRFPEKRIGYLGLMILLDEKQEVLMLVTNSLKNDFSHRNPYIVGLALCSLGNIASADMARDLAGEVEKLFKSQHAHIRKKAACCAIRIIRKVPDLVEDFMPSTVNLLNDKNHAVLLAAIQLIIEMIKIDEKALKHFRKMTGNIVKILKNMVLAGYVSEYDVCGITDPFLQCKIIALLRLLGTGSASASEEMNDILAQVAINTEPTKNPGNAILYECVQTIMSIEAEGGLRVLAVNILGRFLLNRDNNIRYVALNTLCKVVNIDTQAIQRHRNTVVDCLKDSDISIRRRALDLIYALVTKNNVRPLVKELLQYLSMASGDAEFKADLTDKICVVVEKYAPNRRWHIDTITTVLATAGTYTREAVASNTVSLILRSKELQSYAVHRLFQALTTTPKSQLPLVHVAVWTIGEYGDRLITDAGAAEANDQEEDNFRRLTEKEVLDVLEDVARDISATQTTKAYTLNALAKLTTRFKESNDRLKKLIGQFDSSMSLELQQRSVEYGALLSNKFAEIRSRIVNPIPEPVKKKKTEAKADEKGAANDFSGSESEEESEEGSGEEEEDEEEEEEEEQAQPSKAKEQNTPAKSPTSAMDIFAGVSGVAQQKAAAAKAANNDFDILAGIFDAGPARAPAQVQSPQAAPGPAFHNDPISALMAGVGPSAPAQPAARPIDPMAGLFDGAPAAAAQPAAAGGAGGKSQMIAFEKSGLRVLFNLRKPAPDKTQVQALFSNATGNDFHKFDFKVAVPKYLTLRMKPASSTTIPANSDGRVSQLLELQNSAQGQKKIVLRCKIDYEVNGVPVSEQVQVENFQTDL